MHARVARVSVEDGRQSHKTSRALVYALYIMHTMSTYSMVLTVARYS